MPDDTFIKVDIKKREPILFLCCFGCAYLLIITGIVLQHAPALELVTQLPAALLLAFVIYAAVFILRIIYLVISRFWFRK
jgi:hypothetical protein